MRRRSVECVEAGVGPHPHGRTERPRRSGPSVSHTQIWRAISDDEGAQVTGEYVFPMRPRRPSPAVCDVDLQDRLPLLVASYPAFRRRSNASRPVWRVKTCGVVPLPSPLRDTSRCRTRRREAAAASDRPSSQHASQACSVWRKSLREIDKSSRWMYSNSCSLQSPIPGWRGNVRFDSLFTIADLHVKCTKCFK